MIRIKKITIHRFRSISDRSFNADEITIFSGKNNSGKSNILRALNLFFNDEVSNGKPYNYERDYNKAFTGSAGGKRETKITVHFESYGEAALKYPFSISKTFSINQDTPEFKYFSENWEIQKKIDQNDGNVLRQFKNFFNRLEYIYVPAIRDKEFIKVLFLKFESLIKKDTAQSEAFERSVKELSDILQGKSQEISLAFKNFINLPTNASLSSKTSDILGSVVINVQTRMQIREKKSSKKQKFVDIDLFSTGDGILMTYITYFIAHLTQKVNNKHMIWGFEEPENSLEYSVIQDLADKFYNNFRKNAQIFITTHSPAFINLYKLDKVAFYRVFIDENDIRQSSEIKSLEEINIQLELAFTNNNESEIKKLSAELHMVEQAEDIKKMTSLLNDEKLKYYKKRCELEEAEKKLFADIEKNQPAHIFICEDTKAINFWKKVLNKLDLTDVQVCSSGSCTNNNEENWYIRLKTQHPDYNPQIFRELDRDGIDENYERKIYQYQNKCFQCRDLNYKAQFLNVYEIENYIVLSHPEIFTKDFFDQHKLLLSKEFGITAENLCRYYKKRLDSLADKNPFSTSKDNNYNGIHSPWLIEALDEPASYFPGKEMCKLANIQHTTRELEGMIDDNHIPEKLRQYMQIISEFFKK